ncbi:MAG TPA: sulfotransferase [Planctomycetaceae bacterium]|nr:sulfotransferase [Planctomycetaceae bacterium]
MAWTEDFFKVTGPGLTVGITTGNWIRLLAQNRFRVAPRFWPRAAFATLVSFINTPFCWAEEAICSRRVASQRIPPPLFILGHWRSGTTHLQNLLSVDDRFGYPRFAQVMIPDTFLLGEQIMSAASGVLLPANRMGVDGVAMHPEVPWEEEFALCVSTFLSPYMGWAFPGRAEHYDRYLTFRGVPAGDVERWKRSFVRLLQKLTLRFKRPMVLKSPPNTGRIKLLLDIFPDARFVHIHRDPYVVYQSTQHLHMRSWEYYSLQRPDLSAIHHRTIRQYVAMFDAFFEEKSLIPEGRFCEVAYRDLESDPMGQVRRVYQELSLPEFSTVEPALSAYVKSLSGYKKNNHVELSSDLRREIVNSWSRSFEKWQYSI